MNVKKGLNKIDNKALLSKLMKIKESTDKSLGAKIIRRFFHPDNKGKINVILTKDQASQVNGTLNPGG